ncbi:unnamed protein product [Colias eurytheme]|nr:unnamed protein product [Colias eurytheme]
MSKRILLLPYDVMTLNTWLMRCSQRSQAKVYQRMSKATTTRRKTIRGGYIRTCYGTTAVVLVLFVFIDSFIIKEIDDEL